MQFKLIIAMVDDDCLDATLTAARTSGATGVTIIPSGRGEGLKPKKSFFGLELTGQRDILLFVVEAHLARDILEQIAIAARFDSTPGTGIAAQIAIEDVVGLSKQMQQLQKRIEDEI
jgi:hypothetical protein